MEKNAFNILKERGFVKQCSGEKGLEDMLSKEKIAFYAGFDPTADSLHIGSLALIMAMANLQRAGHKVIALVGGATGLVGDPSGKTEMRPILAKSEIGKNSRKILNQLKNYLSFGAGKGLFLDNSKWLSKLNYIDVLRKVGRYFRVNEMIKNEGYKWRLEREEGLSFLEFNYQILQAYDFLFLFGKYGCLLQIGGDDQWGNIVAGVGLVRRKNGKTVFGLTIPLLTTSAGKKMGKTEKGAVWLDSKKTSPYEFYQYWINVDDRDVARFLKLFTFLTLDEIAELTKFQGSELRRAKEVLAFEVTKLAHGEKEAEKARDASKSAFSTKGGDVSSLPAVRISRKRFSAGISVIDLFCEAGLASSKSDAKRLIEQGGAYVNERKISGLDEMIKEDSLKNDSLMLRRGKKQYCLVQAVGEK